jgi:YVTN family beta-propeller protein
MRMLYVANAGDDSIAVIDPGTLKPAQSITLAKGVRKGPRRAVVHKGAFYCINAYTNTLGKYKQGEYTEYEVGAYPTDICVAQDCIMVSCGESDCIWWLCNQEVEILESGTFPIALNKHEDSIICTCMLSGEIRVYTKDMKLTRVISVEGMPMYALRHNGYYYCAHTIEHKGYGLLSVYDVQAKLVGQVHVGMMPAMLKPLGDGRMLVANTGNSTLCVVNLASLECEAWVDVGHMPDDIVFDQAHGRIFVSCMMEDAGVYVLNMQGGLDAILTTGAEPRGMCLGENVL